jgi:hypothetical protein
MLGWIHWNSRSSSARLAWQNEYARRLIAIRRECIDYVVVFGERNLRHVLLSYVSCYNGRRTPLSLSKDAPISRAAETAGFSVARSQLEIPPRNGAAVLP